MQSHNLSTNHIQIGQNTLNIIQGRVVSRLNSFFEFLYGGFNFFHIRTFFVGRDILRKDTVCFSRESFFTLGLSVYFCTEVFSRYDSSSVCVFERRVVSRLDSGRRLT